MTAEEIAAGKPIEGVAILRYDEYGEFTFHVASDERFRLFIVDERAPHDRVYEWTVRVSGEEIAAILGDSPIGSNQDERHAAIKAFVEARMDGRPHLSVVEGTSHAD